MSKYWLLKSEPETYSIDDLKRDKTTPWTGVRNYQARNYLKEMKKGDIALFYHSSCDPAAVVGLAKISRDAYPDPEQFKKQSKYFDEKSTTDKPRWFSPDVSFFKKFSHPLPLQELRDEKALKDMVLLQRGSRLSVQPVSEKEFSRIQQIADSKD